MAVARRGIPPSWWVDVAAHRIDIENEWLRKEVYQPFRNPLLLRTGPVIPAPLALRRITSRTRWRADPTDCD